MSKFLAHLEKYNLSYLALHFYSTFQVYCHLYSESGNSHLLISLNIQYDSLYRVCPYQFLNKPNNQIQIKCDTQSD